MIDVTQMPGEQLQTRWAADGRAMEPLLELWVDTAGTAASVRLSGTLDASTEPVVRRLFDQLLGEGYRLFVIDAMDTEARSGSYGLVVLLRIDEQVRVAGGSVVWNTPGPRDEAWPPLVN